MDNLVAHMDTAISTNKEATTPILLVGAGDAGLKKLQAILSNYPHARIRIVGKQIHPEINQLVAKNPHCVLHEQEFRKEDLFGIDVAFLTTDDRTLRENITRLISEQYPHVKIADTTLLNSKGHTQNNKTKGTLLDAIPAISDVVLHYPLTKEDDKSPANTTLPLKGLTPDLAMPKHKRGARWKKMALWTAAGLTCLVIGYVWLSDSFSAERLTSWFTSLDQSFLLLILAGFLAQMINGALGMGYGVTITSILLSMGLPPATISGSMHTAKIFASGASGFSHHKFGNVNKKLFRALLIPGILGAIVGAVLLTFIGDNHQTFVRPVMATYTMVLGVRILSRAFKKKTPNKQFRRHGWLGGIGGLFDSFGGGGWGPIVTTTLVARGRSPKYTVGTVSLTEFFVTLASAFTFFLLLGISHWHVIIALIIGGTLAAPIAAKLTGRLPRKLSFFLLGILVIAWSLRIIIKIAGV